MSARWLRSLVLRRHRFLTICVVSFMVDELFKAVFVTVSWILWLLHRHPHRLRCQHGDTMRSFGAESDGSAG